MKLKMWMIITAILLVLLFWFAIMSMFYKFFFMALGILSAIFGTILVVKVVAPIINWFNKDKRTVKHEKKIKVKKDFELDGRLRSRIRNWVDS